MEILVLAAGFIFFFPTYLAGPAFEYKDYIYWMKVSLLYFTLKWLYCADMLIFSSRTFALLHSWSTFATSLLLWCVACFLLSPLRSIAGFRCCTTNSVICRVDFGGRLLRIAPIPG